MANETVNRYLNVYIQSGDAQAVYDKLIAKQKELNEKLAQQPKNAAKIREDLAKLEEPISRAAKKLSGELSPSLKDVQATASKLGNRLKKMSTEDADFSTVLTQYKAANKELEEQRGKVGLLSRAMRSFWQEAKTVAVGVLVGNTVQAALQSVLGYITGIVSGSAKISDELADIQRVTGLTTEEVKQLNAELKKIDTRTSASDLREIAVVAGKLGVAKNDILGFVEATDKLSVALGDELGDVNAITENLGKILNVFEGSITGDNITKLGNAIVDLANKGVASGPFLVDFAQRLSGIAKTANLSLGSVLGLAAGLEETGQKVESSSTAIAKLLNTIAQDVPKAAKIAGQNVDEFAELFARAPQEALLLFAQGLQKNKSSFAEIAAAFKDAGEEGARVISTLATLGTKSEFFREKIKDATGALKENNEIQDAFNLKNKNAGAELAKFKKNFAGIFTSSTFQETGAAVIRTMNAFVNVLKATPQFIRDNQTAISLLITGLVLMNKQYIISAAVIVRDTAARVLNTLVTKGSALATNLAISAQAAYITITNLLIGRITLATAAQRLWNVAMSLGAGPLGILLLAAGTLVYALNNLVFANRKLTAEQRLQVELSAKIGEATNNEVATLNEKVALLKNENISSEQKKKILNELIALSPEYLSGLTLQNITTQEGISILDNYIAKLKEVARAKAREEIAIAKERRKLELETEIEQLGGTAGKDLVGSGSTFDILKGFLKLGSAGTLTPLGKNVQDVIEKEKELKTVTEDLDALYDSMSDNNPFQKIPDTVKKTENQIQAVGQSINDLKKKLQDLQEQRDAATDTGIRNSLNKQIEETEKKIASLEGKVSKLSATAKKSAKDMEALVKELQQIAFDLLPDGADKDVQKLQNKYAVLAERARGNNKLLLEIQRLYQVEYQHLVDDYADKAVEAAKKRSAEEEKLEREKQQRAIDRLKIVLPESVKKLGETISNDRKAKAELDVLIKSGKDKLAAQKILLQEEERQELAATNLTEQQKQLIREKYRQQQQELDNAFWVGQLQMVLEFAGQALNIFNIFSQAKTEKENAELERDRAINEKKKRNLENRLKAGTLSQQQYDREVQRMEKEQEKREKEIRQRQFKRDQRAQIIQALMNGAQAVVSTLAARPGSLDIISLGAFRAINIALAVATTAAQVASIASRKAPEFAKGTGAFLKGPSHQDKSRGLPVIHPYTNQVISYMEGGEGVVNKRTMADSRKYQIEGTPSQIISWLNASQGGIHWEAGAKVLKPAWKAYRAQPMDFPAIRRYYAEGGRFGRTPSGASSSDAGEQSNAMLISAIAELREVIGELRQDNATVQSTLQQLQFTLSKGIRSYTVLSEHEQQQRRIEAIREDATMRG